ncbi:MAG: hypothetical protein GQ564_18120 [Bacteroidales bacterium]|nr:hypothetical protein [Bacteroidales bacterium]
MKNISYLLSILLLISSCSEDEDNTPNYNLDFKQEMCDFVIEISEYAKSKKPNFIIIPQNGQELVTINGEEDGTPSGQYLNAIDGVGREDLFYGYDKDDIATPESENEYMMSYLYICESNNVEVLTTDYCSTESKMDDSYAQNNAKGFISFSAPDRELNQIPDYPTQAYNSHEYGVYSLADAKNFLYLLNPEKFSNKQDYINAISNTSYDIIIIDCFYNGELLTTNDVAQLKAKQNSIPRLVISYMSIGEAEDYRYYWQTGWDSSKPNWIEAENPDWEGNYKVKYWETDWRNIIYGSVDSYLDKIMTVGFDGVYMDIIDAFEYFE